MKKLAGVALILLAVALGLGGVLGGVIYAFVAIVMVIMDAVNIFKSPDPVTFWQVAGLVFWWFFREVITVAIVIVSWIGALASGATGYALLTGKKRKTPQERAMEIMEHTFRI